MTDTHNTLSYAHAGLKKYSGYYSRRQQLVDLVQEELELQRELDDLLKEVRQ